MFKFIGHCPLVVGVIIAGALEEVNGGKSLNLSSEWIDGTTKRLTLLCDQDFNLQHDLFNLDLFINIFSSQQSQL